MKPVIVEIDIASSPAVVWEYLANAEHNTEWLANMQSCRWITDQPIRVGSRYEQTARFLAKEVRTTFEVSALEDGRLITISSLPGSSFPLTITRRLEQVVGQGCRVTEIAGGDPAGFYRLAEAPMRLIVNRNITRAYRRLKQLLEDRPAG